MNAATLFLDILDSKTLLEVVFICSVCFTADNFSTLYLLGLLILVIYYGSQCTSFHLPAHFAMFYILLS